jgi:hypothetical protein
MKWLFLSIFVLVIFTGCNCCHQNNVHNTNNQDDYLGMNPRFYLELSKILNKDYIYKTPFADDSLSRFKYFFVLKFFTMDTSLYYSLWVQPFFPEMNKTNDGWVWTDTTNIYYYCINGNSLVILDYLNSHGHGLYQQNTNKQAIEVMQYARDFFEVLTLGEPTMPCISYLIKKDAIVRIPPMLPLKYEKENKQSLLNTPSSY